MTDSGPHRLLVAVIGGSTAGAEVADKLAARGALCVVFEQNDRPYGKVEDGLPLWHRALRRKEYDLIDAKLALGDDAKVCDVVVTQSGDRIEPLHR